MTIKVNVARSPEEAELQAQGVDVMKSMFERDDAGFTEEFDHNAEPGEVPEAAPVDGEAPAEGEAATETAEADAPVEAAEAEAPVAEAAPAGDDAEPA